MTMKRMKGMKTSILHSLHGLKIKLAQVISCTFLTYNYQLLVFGMMMILYYSHNANPAYMPNQLKHKK